jgi:hypothetical protein
VNAYDIGDVVEVLSWDAAESPTGSTGFTDAAGALADPTAVTLTVRAPDGTLSTPSVSKAATGRYSATVSPSQSGTWVYRWVGTGAVTAAAEGAFYVRARRVG